MNTLFQQINHIVFVFSSTFLLFAEVILDLLILQYQRASDILQSSKNIIPG